MSTTENENDLFSYNHSLAKHKTFFPWKKKVKIGLCKNQCTQYFKVLFHEFKSMLNPSKLNWSLLGTSWICWKCKMLNVKMFFIFALLIVVRQMSETDIKLPLLTWKNLTRTLYECFPISLVFCNNSVITVPHSCFIWLEDNCLYFPKGNTYIWQK